MFQTESGELVPVQLHQPAQSLPNHQLLPASIIKRELRVSPASRAVDSCEGRFVRNPVEDPWEGKTINTL